MSVSSGEVFDTLAGEYDAQFTHTLVGRLMRERTWRRMRARFTGARRVLELSCGTGEDAVFLARMGIEVHATDASAAMVQACREKVEAGDVADRVCVRQLSIEALGTLEAVPFDGALSNFGGLNCVHALEPTAADLARVLRPGAYALLCVMGPAVPWEWLWFTARGAPRAAVRRLRRGGAEWRGTRIRYPGVGQLARAFRPYFTLERTNALGALLPPPFTETWARRHESTVRRLDRLEASVEALRPLAWLADHYLVELRRRGEAARARE